MSKISLNVNGKKFEGWTGVTVEKSLFQLTGAFGLSATDIFPGNAQKWGLAMGDECTVSIDNQILITGYIEDIPISYDASGHDIQIGGRDKTGDLVDCSFIEKAKEWKNQKIITVIRALCNPFDITVDIDDSVTEKANSKTASHTFKANEGDVVFDLIFKLCKMKGILPVSYGDGKLVLTGTGIETTYDTLELGKNILSGNINQSNRDRFQTYIVRGQGKQQQGFFKTPTVIAQSEGRYLDELINRHRPIVILPEFGGEQKDFQDRAEWECVTRAGNSRSIDYEVQGWTQSNGEVWPLNTLISVKDSFLEIDASLLIASINFVLNNESGTITRLTLVSPRTFELPPPSKNPTKEISTGFDWAALT